MDNPYILESDWLAGNELFNAANDAVGRKDYKLAAEMYTQCAGLVKNDVLKDWLTIMAKEYAEMSNE